MQLWICDVGCNVSGDDCRVATQSLDAIWTFITHIDARFGTPEPQSQPCSLLMCPPASLITGSAYDNVLLLASA